MNGPEGNRWRWLEVIVIDGTGLKNVHKTHPLWAFAVVSIGDEGRNTFYESEEPTAVDLDNGSNPVWNTYQKFVVNIDEALQKNLYLFVTVKSKSRFSCSPDKFVGEVWVPIEELLHNFGDADNWKLVTATVKNKKRKAHGKLSFKYKLGRTHDPQPADPLPQPADDPLPQSTNANPVGQMCNNNGHTIAQAAVGGAMSGFINTLGEAFIDFL